MNKFAEIMAWIGRCLLAPVHLLVLCTILGFISVLGWPLELFAHLKVQYAVLLAIALPFLCFLKYSRVNRFTQIASALALIANVVAVATCCLSPMLAHENRPSHEIAILQFNVNSANTNYAAFDQLVQVRHPDLICLEEISSGWKEHLQSLKSDYPYQVIRARSDNFGVALLSKFKVDNVELLPLGEAAVPTIWAKIDWPALATKNGVTRDASAGKEKDENLHLQLIVTHPVPPVSGDYTRMRDQQLNLLAAKIAESHCMPMIVAGDLNCTPWSYPFKDFIHGAGLMDSRLNLGIETTWPAAIWPLRMPLDHVLNTPDLDCKQREVEADCGSDHLPVFVRFAASRSGQ